MQPRQPLLPFGGGHFGPLNGLRQLVSPRSNKEGEAFSIPLEEVLEELEVAGVASEEGFSIQRVLQVSRARYRWVWLYQKTGTSLSIKYWCCTAHPVSTSGVGLGV